MINTKKERFRIRREGTVPERQGHTRRCLELIRICMARGSTTQRHIIERPDLCLLQRINIWHALSAAVPFIAWHQRNGCSVPERWILYHWGELRITMGPWLSTIIQATLGDPPHVYPLEVEGGGDSPFCFQEAVVMRHKAKGHARGSIVILMDAYDLIRQKVRAFCNVTS